MTESSGDEVVGSGIGGHCKLPAMAHQSNELLRKAVHIAFGLFALSLAWIPWWAAAAVAAAAVLGNWLVLHRIVGTSIARHERGWDAGIVLYPLAVLILIVIFRHDLRIAAVAWAALAFGDGFATIIGQRIGGARLPWNPDKTWAGFIGFVIAGYIPTYVVWHVLNDSPTWLPNWLIVLGTMIAAAIAESLDLGVDDNLTVPAAAATAAFLLSSLLPPHLQLEREQLVLVLVNAALAVFGYAVRSVDVSGMIGGWILGSILIVFGGPPLYYALLAFFILGTLTTKMGYRRKAAAGLAQERGGRRGFGHAFANVGVAAICAIAAAFDRGTLFVMAGIASLATAAADTVASEVGQLVGKRTFLPWSLRLVPRGTEGAISLEGTVAGVLAAALVSVVAVFTLASSSPRFTLDMSSLLIGPILLLTACAFIGSYVESLVGTWNRIRNLGVVNGALNFFNTAVGATLLLVLVKLRFY